MQIVIVKKPQPIESVIITLTEKEAVYLKYMMHQLRLQYALNGPVDKLRQLLHDTLDKELEI